MFGLAPLITGNKVITLKLAFAKTSDFPYCYRISNLDLTLASDVTEIPSTDLQTWGNKNVF